MPGMRAHKNVRVTMFDQQSESMILFRKVKLKFKIKQAVTVYYGLGVFGKWIAFIKYLTL